MWKFYKTLSNYNFFILKYQITLVLQLFWDFFFPFCHKFDFQLKNTLKFYSIIIIYLLKNMKHILSSILFLEVVHQKSRSMLSVFFLYIHLWRKYGIRFSRRRRRCIFFEEIAFNNRVVFGRLALSLLRLFSFRQSL